MTYNHASYSYLSSRVLLQDDRLQHLGRRYFAKKNQVSAGGMNHIIWIKKHGNALNQKTKETPQFQQKIWFQNFQNQGEIMIYLYYFLTR